MFSIIISDVFNYIKRTDKQYDLIVADPPFNMANKQRLLKLLKQRKILALRGYNYSCNEQNSLEAVIGDWSATIVVIMALIRLLLCGKLIWVSFVFACRAPICEVWLSCFLCYADGRSIMLSLDLLLSLCFSSSYVRLDHTEECCVR